MTKDLGKLATIIAIIGVCIAAIALIPAFGVWLSPRESVQYVFLSGGESPTTNTQSPPTSYSSYPFPSVPNNPPVVFFNEWVNIDSQSNTIKQVSIQTKDGGTYINMFGACSPTDCNFREYSPPPVVNYTYDSETRILHVEWAWDFQIMAQELTITSDGQLRVKTFNHFIDNSGRVDFEMVDYFTRK